MARKGEIEGNWRREWARGLIAFSLGLKEGRGSGTDEGQGGGRHGGRTAEVEERGREKGEADMRGRRVSGCGKRTEGKGRV
jgi:hypothetical protein